MEDDCYYSRATASEYYERLRMWPKDSLKRYLLTNFPGCKSAADAVKAILSQKNTRTVRIEEVEPPKLPNLTTQQDPVVAKLQQVQDAIADKAEGLNLDLIPNERRAVLAAMPLTTVDEVRAWGVAWWQEMQKLRAD